MAIYLISFAVSLLLIAFTEKRRKAYFCFFSIIALLIPCLVAALRAECVGTDILVYVKPMTENAIGSDNFSHYWNSSWFSVWRDKFVYEHEIGFAALVYIVAKLTGSMGAVLFCIQAVTIVPVFVALAMNRKKAPVWLGMLMFYLMYYNSTLNMMRQWMAMGILLLAFQLLLNKKYWQTLLCTLVAILFHYSAVIILPIYFIWWFLRLFRKGTLVQGDIKVSTRMVVIIVIGFVGVLALMNVDLLLKLMIRLGFGRFSNYLSGNALSILFGQIILRLPVLGVTVVSWKRFNKSSPHAGFFLTMMILDLLASQLTSIATYAFRISFYFAMFGLLAVPQVYTCQKTPFEKKIVGIGLSAFFLIYWYYTYSYIGAHETIPYVFNF